MRYCPNPACPHRRDHHVSAEFHDDIERCSDCQATLVDDPGDEEADDVAPPPTASRELYFRAALSVVVPIVVALGLGLIALPGIDREAMVGLTHASGLGGLFNFALPTTAVSLAALGIWPLFKAFVIVEISAMIVPRWRKLRSTGRASLNRAGVVLALILAIGQAYGIAVYVESLRTSEGVRVVAEPSWAVRFGTMAALVAATGVFAAAARFVSRRGLLNGYVAFFAIDAFQQLFAHATRAQRMFANDELTPLAAVIVASLIALFVFGSWRLLYTAGPMTRLPGWREIAHYRRAAKQTASVNVSLQVPTSGIVPSQLVAYLVLFAFSLRNMGVPIPGAWITESTGRIAVEALAVAALAWTLGLVFQNPKRIAALAARATGNVDGEDTFREALESRLRRLNWRTAALLVLVLLARPVIDRWVVRGLFPPGDTLLWLTAVTIDLVDEWRARVALGNVVTVMSEQRGYGAEIATQLLEQASIPSFVRGRHYRALEQVFAPYAPLDVMVSRDDREDALAALAPMTEPVRSATDERAA